MPTQQNETLQRLATNFRALREQRGLTREQLGATTAVDPQMIKRIERAQANPALVVLSRLASAMMISLSLMLGTDLAAEPLNVTAAESEAFDSETVGETLAALRRQRNVSRRQLARLVDLRTGTLRHYETGDTDARMLAIEPIARALSIDAVELVRRIEQRQRDLASGERGEPAPGVEFRLVSSSATSRLWEWRLAPGATFREAPPVAVIEEIVTAVRGRVEVDVDGTAHDLPSGSSIVLPIDRVRSITNGGTSPARLLRFQVLG